MRERLDAALASRWATAALVLAAFAAFWLQSLAWPVQRGRDAWDYLVYYASFFDGATPFPLVMLVRSPVTAFVLGLPMEIGGARLLEIVASVLFVAMVVAWAAVVAPVSRLGAALAALVLLVTAPFAMPFHEPSSDMAASAGFALFCLGLAWTWRRPSVTRFAVLGLGVVGLTLVRPSYQSLLVAVVVPLALPAPWRDRGLRTAGFLAAALVPLVLWAVHNGVRYDDWTVSRSGALNVPFYKAFLAGEVQPDAGPASRRLAGLVRREVLTLPAYRRLGVDVPTYFRSGKNFEIVRLAGLVDRVDGRSSDYALLRDATREASVPDAVVIRGVNVSSSLRSMWDWLGDLPPFEFRTKPDRWPDPPPTIEVAGRPFPNPAAQPPSPDAVPYGFLQCAGDEIARCILADPARVLPADRVRRYVEVTGEVRRWDEGLGAREPSSRLASALDRLRGVLPPTWLWLAVAAVALVVRRPAAWGPAVAIAGLALVLLAVHALGGRPDPFYALPVLPAFPVVACLALTAPRARQALA